MGPALLVLLNTAVVLFVAIASTMFLLRRQHLKALLTFAAAGLLAFVVPVVIPGLRPNMIGLAMIAGVGALIIGMLLGVGREAQKRIEAAEKKHREIDLQAFVTQLTNCVFLDAVAHRPTLVEFRLRNNVGDIVYRDAGAERVVTPAILSEVSRVSGPKVTELSPRMHNAIIERLMGMTEPEEGISGTGAIHVQFGSGDVPAMYEFDLTVEPADHPRATLLLRGQQGGTGVPPNTLH
ncbi:MAG: hypothetical protein AAGF12_17255 [Myxococcota bacterium]